jgi:hypothetical protein
MKVLRLQGTCQVARVDYQAIEPQNQFGLYGNPESREEYCLAADSGPNPARCVFQDTTDPSRVLRCLQSPIHL